MARFDMPDIDENVDDGTDLSGWLDQWQDALETLHKGSGAPGYVKTGMLYLDDAGDPVWAAKVYDGADHIKLLDIDTTNNGALYDAAAGDASNAAYAMPNSGLYEKGPTSIGVHFGGTEAFSMTPTSMILAGASNAAAQYTFDNTSTGGAAYSFLKYKCNDTTFKAHVVPTTHTALLSGAAGYTAFQADQKGLQIIATDTDGEVSIQAGNVLLAANEAAKFKKDLVLFLTGGTERLRIDSNGALNPTADLQLFQPTGGTNNGNILFDYSDSFPGIRFRKGTTNEFSISGNASSATASCVMDIDESGGRLLIRNSSAQALMTFIENGPIVVNGAGLASTDFRVDGSTASSLLFCDAGLDSIGIGTNTPTASAKLDISSTTGAFMPPRMTTTQRDALTASEGMVIANTTTNALEYYDGTSWVTAAS